MLLLSQDNNNFLNFISFHSFFSICFSNKSHLLLIIFFLFFILLSLFFYNIITAHFPLLAQISVFLNSLKIHSSLLILFLPFFLFLDVLLLKSIVLERDEGRIGPLALSTAAATALIFTRVFSFILGRLNDLVFVFSHISIPGKGNSTVVDCFWRRLNRLSDLTLNRDKGWRL